MVKVRKVTDAWLSEIYPTVSNMQDAKTALEMQQTATNARKHLKKTPFMSYILSVAAMITQAKETAAQKLQVE